MTMIRPISYGASRMSAYYGGALRDEGHDVHVVYSREVIPGDARGTSVVPEMNARGITTQHIPHLTDYLNPCRRNPLIGIASEWQADVVISSNLRDAPAAMQAAKKLRIPGIVFAQNLPRFTGLPGLRSLKRWLYLRTVRHVATHTVCVAHGVARELVELCGVPKDKVSTAPNGLDLNSIPPREEGIRDRVRAEFGFRDELLLLNLARLHEQKGQIFLLEAILKLRDAGDCPPFRLLIAGDAESPAENALKVQLQEFVRVHRLEQQVRFLGFRTDGFRLLQAADLFVLSSIWEGLPLVVLEAFGVECPVLMSEYGDRFENFRDGVDGSYVKAGDSSALADGIRRMLRLSPEAQREIGRNGRNFVEQHLSAQRGKQLFIECVSKVLKEFH